MRVYPSMETARAHAEKIEQRLHVGAVRPHVDMVHAQPVPQRPPGLILLPAVLGVLPAESGRSRGHQAARALLQ
ncbi:hypothetical protein RZS08_37275, partial [Arthrospira platensis SPKY1]|nr:hypothetical protein [Arthrospira platensis SPKY1]